MTNTIQISAAVFNGNVAVQTPYANLPPEMRSFFNEDGWALVTGCPDFVTSAGGGEADTLLYLFAYAILKMSDQMRGTSAKASSR